MLKELFAVFAVLLAAPFCMGLLPALAMPGEQTVPSGEWERKTKKTGKSEPARAGKGHRCMLPWRRPPVSVCPAAVFAAGFLMELAIFQILAVPVIIREPWGFPHIVTGYTILLVLFSAAGLFFGFPVLRGMAEDLKTLAGRVKTPGRKEKSGSGKKGISPEPLLYWLLAGGLVVFQVYMAYTRAFFDGDDAYYVVQSVITDETDVLCRILPYTGLSTSLDMRHALASLPVWEAYLARITGIHPTIIAHSLLPLVLLPLTYMLYFRIGMKLFHSDGRKTAIFLILVSVLQIFGNTSIYTNATFFLMRTWQGKSILCNLVLLAVIWILLGLREEKAEEGQMCQKSQWGWWLLLCVNNVTAAMCTTMGAFLTGLFIAVAGLVMAVRKRRPGILIPLAACCIPCLVYLLMYLVLA